MTRNPSITPCVHEEGTDSPNRAASAAAADTAPLPAVAARANAGGGVSEYKNALCVGVAVKQPPALGPGDDASSVCANFPALGNITPDDTSLPPTPSPSSDTWGINPAVLAAFDSANADADALLTYASSTASSTTEGTEDEAVAKLAEITSTARSMFVEGHALWYGLDFHKEDGDRGQALIEAAASAGFPTAEAYCHFRGWGGRTADYEKSFAMFKQIANDTGCAYAENMLGLCFQKGYGVDQDLTRAVVWFTTSAEKENSHAMNNLGDCFEEGDGVEKNPAIALEWYTKAADLGNSRAMSNLGVCYESGDGVEQNFTKAVEWYTKSAKIGDTDAMFNLADCFERGNGVEKNFKKALEWYTKAQDGDAELESDLEDAIERVRRKIAYGGSNSLRNDDEKDEEETAIEAEEELKPLQRKDDAVDALTTLMSLAVAAAGSTAGAAEEIGTAHEEQNGNDDDARENVVDNITQEDIEEHERKVTVTINGVTDELRLEKLLTVHRAQHGLGGSKNQRTDSSVMPPTSSEIREKIAKGSISRLVNGRWVLAPPPHRSTTIASQLSSKKRMQKRRKRLRKAASLAKEPNGSVSKVQEVCGAEFNVTEVNSSQRQLRRTSNRQHRDASKTSNGSETKRKSSLLGISPPPVLTSVPLTSPPSSTSPHRQSNPNWQPWNPVLTNAERRRREDRNMRRRLKAAGIAIENGRGRRSPQSTSPGGGNGAALSEPKLATYEHVKAASKSASRSEPHARRQPGSSNTSNRYSRNNSRYGSANRDKSSPVKGSIVDALLELPMIYVIVSVLLVALVLVGSSLRSMPTEIQTHLDPTNAGMNRAGEEQVVIGGFPGASTAATSASTAIPALRITYPGQGETVLKADSIVLRWAFSGGILSSDNTAKIDEGPTSAPPEVPMKLTVNGRETFTLDKASRLRKSLNLRGLDAGEYSMALSTGRGLHTEVTFVVVDIPAGLDNPGALKGERQVLRALPSDVLLRRLGERRIPAVRRQMIEQILEDRQ